MKAKPIVPAGFRPEVEPETSAGAASLTRRWQIRADPASLPGKAFGLEGLLGTPLEVRFLLTTLDGRRYETVLRSTQSVFYVPPPPATGRLVADSARDGLRHSVRNVGIWFVLAWVLFSGISIRLSIWITLAVTAAFLGSWATLITVSPRAGLSDAEFRLMRCFQVAGFAGGIAGVVAVLELFRSLIPDGLRLRIHTCSGILATAWVLYEGSGQLLLHGPAGLAWIERIAENVAYRWFSPFAADWAMARLRVPLLSIMALALFAWALVKIKRTPVRLTASGILLILAFALLPYGVVRASVPFLTPEALSPRQARRIIEPMLSEIYHALNLQDEGETYDQLAEQVSGDLVTDLYLDSRRRLVAGTRKGASVVVRRVEVQKVGAPKTAEGRNPAYPCTWTVTAKVTHWQHLHQRRNMYGGEVRLIVEDDRWKLESLNLHSEEREVVPGSFSSR